MPVKKSLKSIGRLKDVLRHAIRRARGRLRLGMPVIPGFAVSFPQLIFSQGLGLVILGSLAILFPRLVVLAIAAFFVFFGTFMCVLAYKILHFQRRWAEVLKKFEARVVVQGVNARDLFAQAKLDPKFDATGDVVEDEAQPPNRKIVLH